ncbi:MAG: endonuclease MutS2 [Bacteroidales bacterium]|jgi:DNA mismatch repair protein MutS2|nr:endonuclease MutS2 [Bacteroidales bacterium]
MTEAKLSFGKIRDLVKSECLSDLGKEKCDQMSFLTNFDTILEEANRTNEFVRILQEEDFPTDGFYDVREAIQRIKVVGTYIEPAELFDLSRVVEAIGSIVSFFSSKEEGTYYYLQELSRDVFTFPDILRAISRILDKYGQIKDTASSKLGEIRREKSATEGSISRNMSSILRKAVEDGIVEKGTTPAVRDGRLVIPISPFFKKKLRGIVHDESATGKTVFIEPEVIVEANNKLRELEAEEQREIVRILTEFTTEILRPRTDELLFSVDYLSVVDFTRAKAQFALKTNSVMPKLRNEQVIDWRDAIHPLLFLSHQASGKEIVPLDIRLDKNNRILLISGPNAGGKSVCLKSVGLIQYMAQCGMLVPMHADSEVGIFNDILINIGDEQSIENDLSTYSSHLSYMKEFAKKCNGKTILLIDEFGGGTEPRIGGAIAEALLDHFNRQKSFGVITTHFTNLKQFATDTDGIVNGAMLYDRHEMRPLFRLEIGNPGSSFALEIARKIGLPESVIARATEIVGNDYVNMEKYLQDIVRDKRYWENKRQNIRQKEKHIEELEEKLTVDVNNINAERKRILSDAKAKSKELLDGANAKIERTIKLIKEAKAEKEATRQAREDLTKYKSEVVFGDENDAFAKKVEKLNAKSQQKSGAPAQQKQEKPISVGDTVKIKSSGAKGKVLEIKGNSVDVALGNLRTTVKLKDLQLTQEASQKTQKFSFNIVSSNNSDIVHERSRNFKQQIDVRGMRADETIQAVSYYIEDAIMLDAGTVRILHGTGTGVLRQVIREYLKTVPQVKSFRDEHVDFGGAGITVVEVG